ncbi:hypothetical protein GUJ93_ZPchr0006g44429 [Zizania palustris]|uniref:Uncharacterized protein n=1 Tax=Zizania palustris TaxID=103762 RepID=A0A8J5SBB9_ZIZPA|nr:hypothetical protein GUJ93_ZPchr0006g44429 [Zizania palustris]
MADTDDGAGVAQINVTLNFVTMATEYFSRNQREVLTVDPSAWNARFRPSGLWMYYHRGEDCNASLDTCLSQEGTGVREDMKQAEKERLGQHLDVVEAHLVREIARRSESFYEAQGRLVGLDGEIVAAVGRIRELRDVVRVLTGDLVGAARQVQELNATRGNLVALQQKLTVILYVSQALAALKLVFIGIFAFH